MKKKTVTVMTALFFLLCGACATTGGRTGVGTAASATPMSGTTEALNTSITISIYDSEDKSLLDGLIDVVNIACDDCFWNIREHFKEGLYLACHPTETLALEGVTIADFLVQNMDVLGIMDMNALLHQQSFELTILNGGVEMYDILFKPLIVKAHAGANQG